MHLQVAEQIRAHPAFHGLARQQVLAAWPSFYLGSIAPDFQDITDIPREATHFYALPPDPQRQAQDVMLETYPMLARPGQLSREQAVFIAAYRAHLMLDLRWFHQILAPFFIFNDAWDGVGRYERFTAHNTLLTYLDRLALESLPPAAAATLANAPTLDMAPFIPAGLLAQWQTRIVEQLAPGAPIRTVEIYAQRLRMTPAQFARNLADPLWMKEQLFSRISLTAVQAILTQAVDESADLVMTYLNQRVEMEGSL